MQYKADYSGGKAKSAVFTNAYAAVLSEFSRIHIDALGVPELKQAISAYHSVTASTEFQELERMRAKAQHDEAQALWNAENKKATEIAKNALNMNLLIDDIVKLTGLSKKEVEALRDRDVVK